MTKQKKVKRTGLVSLMKDAREAVLKRSINVAVVVIFLAVVFLMGKAYIYRSDYFKLRKVEVKDTLLDQKYVDAIKLRLLNAYRNKSVFRLDLKAIALALQAAYPDSKDVSVALGMPDKMVVSLKVRRAVVVVRSDKLYPVDEEGVMLPVTDPLALRWAPVVDGARLGPDERRRKAINSRNLKTAIALLRAIKNVKPVADQGIEAIDVKDPGNIIFYLRNGIEVRIGGEDLKGRLEILAKTLRDPRLIMDRIKYIDLRFGDAVIGPK